MAKVTWSTGIEHVSGALSKPSKSGQHSCSKMLLATHRVAATTSKDCNRLYMRNKPVRSTPVTSTEQVLRARFTAISRAVQARKRDLSLIASDITNFNAQKNNANGYKTIKQYLWHICANQYDQAQG